MKSFGTILREAREAKGLTPSQVAHDTHMLVQIVEEMEREDFHRIPAPIYGHGFVRLYAERMGLDPAPLIAEFMEIYQGRKSPLSASASSSAAAAPAPAPQPAPEPAPAPAVAEPPPAAEPPPVAEPPAAVQEPAPADAFPPADEQPVSEPPVAQSLFAEAPAESSSDPAPKTVEPPTTSPAVETPAAADPAPAAAPANNIPPSVRGLDLFDPEAAETRPLAPPPPVPPRSGEWESPFVSAYTEEPEESAGGNAAQRFREGLTVVSHGVLGRVRQIPRNTWRIAVLVLAAILLITLAAWGARALYKATSEIENPDLPPAVPPTAQPAETKPAAAPATKQNAKPAPAKPAKQTGAKPASDAKPAAPKATQQSKGKGNRPALPKSGDLKSTGPRIEPLYID